jgi:hypothetical protein
MKSPELSLEHQINRLSQRVEEQEVVTFFTVWERRNALSRVVNRLARKRRKLHFQVCPWEKEEVVLLLILPHKSNKKGESYTWVEQSKLTGKWLVMASPPGAYDIKCITVWNEQNKALEISSEIFESILNMPLQDWQLKKGKFKGMLASLPDDDDAPVLQLAREWDKES